MVKSSRSSENPATRREILNHMKSHGPSLAADMAERFGLTPMAVRLHLYALEREGQVTSASEPSGRGRPAKRWRLTPAAEHAFPDAHKDLAIELLGAVRDAFGAEGIAKLMMKRAGEQLKRYKAAMKGTKTLKGRLSRLADMRNDEGYMATVERDGKGWLLIENHCPICSAAQEAEEICTSELDIFKNALGPGCTVRRTEHIVSGNRRCAYKVAAR